jgi:protein-disulfide isomerase
VTDGETAGSPTAPVTLTVYADFQCPICGRFVREQLGNLKTQFIDTGILRVESRDLAILGRGTPDESLALATGARCSADQGRYWAYHDLVYWNQQRENQGDYTAEFIRSIAIRAGVDTAKWDSCIAGTTARAAVLQASQAALSAGINSTPTLSLNGSTPVAGLPDAQSLITRIRSLASVAPASLIPASGSPEVSPSGTP